MRFHAVAAVCLAPLFLLACGSKNSSTQAAQNNVPSGYLIAVSNAAPLSGTTIVVSAQAIDADGRYLPAAGRKLVWHSEGGGTFSEQQTTTDENGASKTEFTTALAERSTHVLWAEDSDGIESDRITLISVAPDPEASLSTSTISLSPKVIVADGMSTATATVHLNDQIGRPFLGEVVVQIHSSLGLVGDTHNHEDGTYSAVITAGVQAGVGTVSATVDGEPLAATQPLTLVPMPDAYLVSVSNNNPLAGSSVEVHFTLVDESQNAVPVAGRTLTLQDLGSAGGTFTENEITTGADGTAMVGFTVSDVPGAQHIIEATDQGGISGQSAPITVRGGVPAGLLKHSGDAQSARAGDTLDSTAEVQVLDEDDNPIEGVIVDFAIVDGSGELGQGSHITNASGIAGSGPWTLGPRAGANILRATVDELAVAFDATAASPIVLFECLASTEDPSLDCIASPEGSAFMLTTENLAYNSDNGQFTFDAHLTNQSLFRQGTEPHYLRVAFMEGPTPLVGAGTASVFPDGFATFTEPGQPYYKISEILAPEATSDAKPFTLIISPSITSFSFAVAVFADRVPLVVYSQGNHLYRIDAEGGPAVQLTHNSALDTQPTVHGDTVVFVSHRDGNAELYSMSLAGDNITRITQTTYDESHPHLSPGGQRIIYAANSAGAASSLWHAQSDGSAPASVFPADAASMSMTRPSWFPRGEEFVFTVATDTAHGLFYAALPFPDVAPLHGDLEVVNDVHAVVSPSGDHAVFVSDRDGDFDLYLLTIATSNWSRLTERVGADRDPAWLTDEDIVYIAEDPTPRLRRLSIHTPGDVVDLETGGTPSYPAVAR